MAKVHNPTARQDIYRHGKRTPADNKQKYTLDRSQPRDENDVVIVKKGQKYYHWTLYKSTMQISLTPPRQSQLTGSAFLQQLYSMQEQIADCTTDIDAMTSLRDEIVDQANNLKDETESSLDNMPEGLREGDTGQMLQSRIDGLDQWISELEAIDFEIDEDIDKEGEEYEEMCVEKYNELQNCECSVD